MTAQLLLDIPHSLDGFSEQDIAELTNEAKSLNRDELEYLRKRGPMTRDEAAVLHIAASLGL